MGIIISLLSMAFYVTETVLQLNDAFTVSHFWTFVVIIGLISGPLIITNVISAVLVLRTMDFSGKVCGKLICIILHICQFGLLWRFSKLFILYDEHDWKEFMTLRVVHTALQSLPYLTIKGYYMLQYNDVSATAVSTVIITLISACIVMSMYNLGDILFESDEFLDFKARVRRPIGIMFVIAGTLLILLARCGSLALMGYSLAYWIAIPLGVHYFTYLLISTISLKCNDRLNLKMFFLNFAVSYLCIFDVVISEFRRIRCKYVLYYSAVLVENIVMTAIWMITSNQDYVLKLITVVGLLSSLVFGGILKCCSCGYVQEDTSDPSADDSLNIADHLQKENLAKNMSNALNSPNTRAKTQQGQNGDAMISSQSVAEIHVENISGRVTEINGIKVKTKPGKTKSRSSKESGSTQIIGGPTLQSPNNKRSNIKDRYNMRLQTGDSNADIASSNSRNTNTLNLSNQSNHLHTIEDNELVHFNERAKASLAINNLSEPYSNKYRPVLGVRSSSPLKIDANNLLQSPQIKKGAKGKQIDIPLFPNDCNTIAESKVFGSPKQKHILSNSVAEYRMDDTYTETSYSEYLSYSYYIDSTEWSSMSCDSDFASTWPPSNPFTFVNLHCLPREKISTTENVHLWLSKLDEWEPSFDSQNFDILNQLASSESTSKSLQNLNNEEMAEGELVRRRSSIHGQKPEISKTQNPPYRKVDNILSKPVQNPALLSNSIVNNRYNETVSVEYDLNETVPRNFNSFPESNPDVRNQPIIVWHSDDTSQPDVVQESVV